MEPACGPNSQICSPDGRLQVAAALEAGSLNLIVERDGAALLRCRNIGLQLADGRRFGGSARLVSSNADAERTRWETVWGRNQTIDCRYNALSLDLEGEGGDRFELQVRVFDDAVAYRVSLPDAAGRGAVRVIEETGDFVFGGDWDAWWITANHHNSYEQLYRRSPLRDLNHVETPLTLRRSDGVHACLHEAAIRRYPTLTLRGVGENRLRVDPVRWSDGDLAKTSIPFATPWRVILVSDDAAGLADSETVLNLNPPSRIADPSWIRPAKFVGVWWEMHRRLSTWASGPHHGATTENALRHIAFARAHSIGAVLIEGWNTGWDGNWTKNREQFSFTQCYPDFDLSQVCAAARDAGVQLILQNETAGGVARYLDAFETAYDLYAELGVSGVKTGHVALGRDIDRRDETGAPHKELHGGQYMIDYLHAVLDHAAKRRLVLDVHEPVLAGGLHRTYPNLLALEGARGQEYNAWSEDGGNPPDHVLILPFTRLIDGPFDYTPGVIDLLFASSAAAECAGQSIHDGAGRAERPALPNRVNHTLAKELALYVLLPSPLQMAADLIDNYVAAPAFDFIKAVPTDWRWSRTLTAEIGAHMVAIREARDGGVIALGAATAQAAFELDLPLDFLDPDRIYRAEIYRDGTGAHWRDNPLALDIEHRRVDADDVLALRLAPGGGQAVLFVPD